MILSPKGVIINITGLETGEIMIFDNNAYVVVKVSETGLGAFELLVDPVSQTAYPEYGPDMMWNLKYGGFNWNYQNTTPADDPTQFYGYYTLDFEKDGKVIGMLSLDGYNGQIFLHTWHGTFIEESESQ